LGLRIRKIIIQVAGELDIEIINGVPFADRIHIFVSICAHITVSEFMKIARGHFSRKIQQKFSEIVKKYWIRHFLGREYFSSTSGNVRDEMINPYIEQHADAHRINQESNFSLD
jgi:putative transposase